MSFYDVLGWLMLCVCASSVPIRDFTFFTFTLPLPLASIYATLQAKLHDTLRGRRRSGARAQVTHSHTHTPDSSVAVSAGVYRSNLDLPQIIDARSIGSSICVRTLGFIWTKQQRKSLCYVQRCMFIVIHNGVLNKSAEQIFWKCSESLTERY